MTPLPDELADAIAALSRRSSAEEVLDVFRMAQEVATTILDGSDEARCALWNAVFGPLYRARANYQFQDFELVDYGLDTVPGMSSLIRGPVPSPEILARGDYICVLGAAQLFGRFSKHSFAQELETAYGLPVLNLSQGGAGPEAFLGPACLDHIRRARLVIVQVLSGRSAGCEKYPGGMYTKFDGVSMAREHALKLILQRSSSEYRETVHRWSRTYTDAYRRLSEAIDGHSILVWVSSRKPREWSIESGERTGNFGPFPHLVGDDVLAEIRELFDGYAEVTYEPEEYGFRSRISEQPAPFMTIEGKPKWETSYYPPPRVQSDLSAALMSEIRDKSLLQRRDAVLAG